MTPAVHCFAPFLTIFRVCTVLHDNCSCRMGSVSCVDPPRGADRHPDGLRMGRDGLDGTESKVGQARARELGGGSTV